MKCRTWKGLYQKEVSTYLLRRTTHGMPILSAATTPVWLPATSTQLHTGTSAYSAPARNVTTTFCKLGKVTQLSSLHNLKVKLKRHCFKCYTCLGFSTSIKFENFNIKDMKRTANWNLHIPTTKFVQTNLSVELVSRSTLNFSMEATSSAILCFSAEAGSESKERHLVKIHTPEIRCCLDVKIISCNLWIHSIWVHVSKAKTRFEKQVFQPSQKAIEMHLSGYPNGPQVYTWKQ